MTTSKSKYVTTPIYYVNDVPHVGHSYTDIAADVWARFMRLDGHNTMFLTGTDEHGQKVDQAAAKKGVSPQAFTDEVSERFQELTPLLNLSNDDFIRTTQPRHQKAVQAMWNTLKDKGQIYLDSYAGWYAVRDEAYYAETDIKDGKAPTGAPVEWVEEPSYFFKLSEWQDKLIEYYEANPECIVPKSRYNEVMSFVKGGLRDLSVSRTSFKWGVPVPNDPDHVIYVWIDALTNYISALGFPDQDSDKFKEFWPNSTHIIGKDILKFHAVYWPAMMMAAGLQPPKKIVAHGWWTIEGQKMSKSLGNAVNPHDAVEEFGLDAFRFFLLREVPFGNDGDYSRAAFIRRTNTNLSNDLGNLVQRVFSMIYKNCDEKIPENHGLIESDTTLIQSSTQCIEVIRPLYEAFQFSKVLEQIWEVIAQANRYVDEQAPWALRKTDPARMNTVLFTLATTIRNIALLVEPFMPDASKKILELVDAGDADYKSLNSPLKPGNPVKKPEPIFPRFEEEDTANVS